MIVANVMFVSTVAGKTLDAWHMNISTQNVTVPNYEPGLSQTGIGMSLPTIGTYYKPGTIRRVYQGAATTMYLNCNLLCVTPVNFIKPFTVIDTATCIA